MGLVDDQHGVVIARGLGQRAQRSGVPVHAEEGFGDQQPAAGATGFAEQALGRGGVGVGGRWRCGLGRGGSRQ